MPESFNRGTAFGQGFSLTSNASSNRRQVALMEKRNQQEQQRLVREDFLTKMKDNIAIVAKHTQDLVPGMFTEQELAKPIQKRGNTRAHQSFVQTTWDNMLPAIEMAVAKGFISKDEAQIITKQYDIATTATDPRPAQDLAARGEQVGEQGKTLGKEAAISSDVAQANRDADNARAIKLRQTPTTQNVNEQTVGGADSRPPGGEVFEGIGRSIMDDIRQSSGAFAAASKAISRTGGQAISGTNPRIDSESRVNNFNQEIKAAFTRNPRFPVSELEKISDELLPDPKAIFTDPESEARKIPLLKNHLENLNEVDSRALQGALSKSGRNDTIDRMATRQAVIDLIGNVPDISEQADARTKDLERIGIENMTEQQMDEYLELTK